MKKINIEDVRPQPEVVGEYVALSRNDSPFGGVYVLYCELEGYIFRLQSNPQYGHSGHHPTRTAACYSVLQYPNPHLEVIEFDTRSELNHWIASLQPKPQTINRTII